LFAHRVECIILGGVALVLHGSTRVTLDIDILYCRRQENIQRLATALTPFSPKLHQPGSRKPIDFSFGDHAMYQGGTLSLWTREFDIDLLQHTDEYPNYEAGLDESEVIETSRGRSFRILSLDALLRINQRRNRVDDQLALPEIEALIEIRDLGRGGV
jgi:hypothetical protein